MKHRVYRILALVFSLCLVCGALAFSACGDGEGGTVDYSVTLTCEDPIYGGLIVQIKKEDGSLAAEKGASMDGGTLTFTLEKGSYTVMLAEKKGFEGTLTEYVYSIATVTAEKPSVAINIVPVSQQYVGQEKIAYNVTVQKPDGTPVEGVSVQLCGGPTYVCNFAVTDENGVAAFELPAGSYEVHIEQKIEGFTFDNSQYKMGQEGGALTVTLTAENA